MRPRLLALDLDGTLMTYDNRLPMGHVHAVHDLRRMGITVAICTGRSLRTTRWIWEALDLDCPLVCFNGSWVGTPDRPFHPIAQAGIDTEGVRDIMAELQDRDGAVCCYPDPYTWVMNRELERTANWAQLYGADIRYDASIATSWAGLTFKVMYVDEPAAITATARMLQHQFGRRFQVVVSQEDRLEILPRGISKAWGLAHLADHLGVARDDVWAAGDADNDREMLLWAGHPCVMGQAEDRLMDLAQYRLPSIEARGLCALVPILERELAEDP
jgi:Cof subfamily protein (haloacid dehalogenase superfamily)